MIPANANNKKMEDAQMLNKINRLWLLWKWTQLLSQCHCCLWHEDLYKVKSVCSRIRPRGISLPKQVTTITAMKKLKEHWIGCKSCHEIRKIKQMYLGNEHMSHRIDVSPRSDCIVYVVRSWSTRITYIRQIERH